MKISDTKIGICFPGGGARGALQAGAMAALYEAMKAAGIGAPWAVSGASVGVLNACLFCQAWHLGPDEIGKGRELWSTLKPGKVHSRIPRPWPWSLGLFKTKPLSNLIQEHVSPSAIAASGIRFEVFATMYGVKNDPRLSAVNTGFLDVVLGSASYPVFFEPVPWAGGYLADAGITNNCPTDQLIDQGCDLLIVLRTSRRDARVKREMVKPTWWRQAGMIYGEMMESHLNFQTERIRRINQALGAPSTIYDDPKVDGKAKRRVTLVEVFPPVFNLGTLEFKGDQCQKAYDEAKRAAWWYFRDLFIDLKNHPHLPGGHYTNQDTQ